MNSDSPSKVAVITGAGSGVGRAVALVLLQEGYKVSLAGRRQAMLDETRELAGERAANALVIPTDVTDEAAVKHLFDETVRAFGRVDVLFNNAGRGAPAVPIEDLPVKTWREVVEVNLTGMFMCAQAAIRVMKAQSPKGGRIINNGSISAHAPRPMAISYTSTKHAISGMTKTIALDCRADNIACGQIDIGNAVTDLTERMAAGVLQADGVRRAEPRMAVKDVADAVKYMAGLPLSSNVLTMTVMATTMPFVGRG